MSKLMEEVQKLLDRLDKSPMRDTTEWRWGRQVEELRAALDPGSEGRWICENPECQASFAEYINGCPKCSERGLAFSVLQQPHPQPSRVVEEGVYVASRASVPERSAMWRRLRAEGWPIVSTWIDEAGEGETENFAELWLRISREIASAGKLIFYAEAGDFPLKGALIEVGIALGLGKTVCAVLPGVQMESRTYRPVGSWIAHPQIHIFDTVEAALAARLRATPTISDGELARQVSEYGMTQEKLEELAAGIFKSVSDKIGGGWLLAGDKELANAILAALQTAVAEQQELDAKIAEDYIGEYSSHKAICWAIAQTIREGKKERA
jgi:hypothetical protein